MGTTVDSGGNKREGGNRQYFCLDSKKKISFGSIAGDNPDIGQSVAKVINK
jgi:hypothetical protein